MIAACARKYQYVKRQTSYQLTIPDRVEAVASRRYRIAGKLQQLREPLTGIGMIFNDEDSMRQSMALSLTSQLPKPLNLKSRD